MNFVPVSLAMQRQGTIQFNKSRSATCTSSSGKDSSGLVQTASGNFHYVSKSVNFGVEHSEQTDGSPSANGSGLSDRSPSESSWEDAKRKGGCVEGPPPRGETRHVYLDMQWTKFGFRLQVSRLASVNLFTLYRLVINLSLKIGVTFILAWIPWYT